MLRILVSDTTTTTSPPTMTLPASLPRQIRKKMQSWETISKSPYGWSWYSIPGKTWNHTPEGCIRVSDHWNWVNATGTHCQTNRPVRNGDWTMARYESGVWVVIVSMRANDELSAYVTRRNAMRMHRDRLAVVESGNVKAIRAEFGVTASRAKEMIYLHKQGYQVV